MFGRTCCGYGRFSDAGSTEEGGVHERCSEPREDTRVTSLGEHLVCPTARVTYTPADLTRRGNKLYVNLSRRPVRGKFGVRRHAVS